MVIKSTALEFNPRHPKYQCCCGILSAKTGAIVFGVLEAIGLAASIVLGSIVMYVIGNSLDQGPYPRDYGIDSRFIGRLLLPISLLLLPVVVMMVYFFKGIAKDKASWLVPHLFMQVVGLMVLYVYVVFVLWGLIELKIFSDKIDAAEEALEHVNSEDMENHQYRSISSFNGYNVTFKPAHLWGHFMRGCWGSVFAWLASALFQYWRLRVVYSYYVYCKDKSEWERSQVNCCTLVSNEEAPPMYAEPQTKDKEEKMFIDVPIV